MHSEYLHESRVADLVEGGLSQSLVCMPKMAVVVHSRCMPLLRTDFQRLSIYTSYR